MCPNHEAHTPQPTGYVHRADWAEEMSKTHHQIVCEGCGLFAIWVPNKKGDPVSTPHQREALKLLEPMGFKALGYRKDGYMIATHPAGYSVSIASTPSDSKTMKNLIAEAERGVKRMGTANFQFQQWLWEKHSIQPGESRPIELSIPTEIRQFFQENGIDRGGQTNAISQWIRQQGTLQLADPDKRGKGPHEYVLSRPPEVHEVITPLEPQVGMIVKPIPVRVVDQPRSEEEPTPVVPNGSLADVDPDMVRQLQAILARPIQEQLNDKLERLGLVWTELEAVETRLNQTIIGLTQVSELITNLKSVLEG